MARNISNRIFISFMEDGTNVHGSLTSTTTLAQGWDPNKSVAAPDWRPPAQGQQDYRPLIYLPLCEGSTPKPPVDYAWTYDGETLGFDGSGNCTNRTYVDGGQTLPLFKKETYTISGIDMPALRINGNIATANSATLHNIGISGTVDVGGVTAPFSDTIPISVATLNSSGYMAVLNFDGGTSLDGDDDSVTATASLFTAAGEYTGNWTAAFELNEDPVTASVTGEVILNSKSITIYGKAVTDVAVLTLNAKIGNDVVATAIHEINDIGDPEYMWIQYKVNGGDGNNDAPDVSLHERQSVTYSMWVAKNNDIEAIDTAFTTFEIQPRKADGTVLTAAECATVGLSGSRDSDGFVTITGSVNTPGGQTITGGTLTIAYATRTTFGAQASGIVRAKTSSNS